MKVRRQARTVALQVLFEVDSVNHSPAEAFQHRLEEEYLPPEGIEFARGLIEGTLAHRASLDSTISRFAPEWPVHQLAIVDRNVLRIALYELEFVADVPSKVAINEAVELAKIFGSDSSPRFVNGVLGAFMTDSAQAGKQMSK